MTILKIHDISLQLKSNICFENFTSQIIQGEKIALIGNNGSGKSSLLKLLRREIDPINGYIEFQSNLRIEYINQIIDGQPCLSGGEKFNKEFFQKIELNPDLLLLDEPTNHLDSDNKKTLLSVISSLPCAVIFATHDKELIDQCADTIWHIDNGTIHKFNGDYASYICQHENNWEKLEYQFNELNRKKQDTHNKLMKEQERAKKSKQYGRNKHAGDRINLSAKKRKGEITTGNRKSDISDIRDDLNEKMKSIYKPKKINPKFAFDQEKIRSAKNIIEIRNGSVGYEEKVLSDISLHLASSQRLAIKGKNGSGKTTLIKAIMSDECVTISGEWNKPCKKDIGYLDQFYNEFHGDSPFDAIKYNMPNSNDQEIRRHLNCYLFSTNEQAHDNIEFLSGGERARLSMAIIASRPFKLLVLDEPTNNIDLETKGRLIEVLNNYNGSLLVISHDNDFLEQINIDFEYSVDI